MRQKVCLLMGIALLLFNLTGCQNSMLLTKGITLYPDLITEVLPIHLPPVFEPDSIEPEEALVTDEWTLARPNELGGIMVVMYHRLSEKEGLYDRSIEHFKSDLERLYNEGYRPVTMDSVINGTIDLPAGLSPVVLTFDDGHVSNFKYLEDQTTISPECVIGIMLEFQKNHPGFEPHGVFYLTGPTPFGQREMIEKKLQTLVELGFEVGNHTVSHKDLKKLSAVEITDEIGAMNQLLEKWSGQRVENLSIPYGNRPKAEDVVAALNKNQTDTFTYEMKSIVNVGWNPIVSPFAEGFTPLSINRVICGEGDYSMHYWMDYFIEHPDKKYISDGDTLFVSILEKDVDKLRKDLIDHEDVRIYNWEE